MLGEIFCDLFVMDAFKPVDELAEDAASCDCCCCSLRCSAIDTCDPLGGREDAP